jgi:uncharacterized iron-regulated membrane protein
MHARTIRLWCWVHKWTSLFCTGFLLVLCVSGLPLIFRDEIDHLLYGSTSAAAVPPGTPEADLDRLAAAAVARYPREVVQFILWDPDEPDVVALAMGDSATADPDRNIVVRFDAHTAAYLGTPDVTGRVTHVFLELHTELFAGGWGRLFLSVVGLSFVIAIISGTVLYAPAMRKLAFGTRSGARSAPARSSPAVP